jgi:hypothetical protein
MGEHVQFIDQTPGNGLTGFMKIKKVIFAGAKVLLLYQNLLA